MKLEGIHHITAITGDAPANVEFYVGVLGLRLVKKTVNQDDPTVYHLFYADERLAGRRPDLLRVPGAARGEAGAGMVHRVVWRVASPAAIDFWEQRLAARGVEAVRDGRPAPVRRPRGARARAARRGRPGRAPDRRRARRPARARAAGVRRACARTRAIPPAAPRCSANARLQRRRGRRVGGPRRRARRHVRLRRAARRRRGAARRRHRPPHRVRDVVHGAGARKGLDGGAMSQATCRCARRRRPPSGRRSRRGSRARRQQRGAALGLRTRRRARRRSPGARTRGGVGRVGDQRRVGPS